RKKSRRSKMKCKWCQVQVILLLCFAFVWVEAEYVQYKDPSQPVIARAEDLLRRMTLEEKIGQMTQIERTVASADVMKQYYIGSVLSGGGSVPAPKASPADWVNMVNEFQKGAMSTRLQIPMIYGIDGVHGHNNVYGATIFPHNVGLGATRDPDLVKRIGAATALEIRATGIPYTFAPCIAVCRDPRWGRCYESYSEEPTIVKAMTEIIFGLQGTPPVNATKGIPYVAGQISFPKQVLSMDYISRGLMEGVAASIFMLQGFVISDWQGIDRITSPPDSNYSLSVMDGVGAGIDMVMVPFNYTDFINDLTYQVKGGFISKNRINDAVRRILRVKFSMGLFEHPMADLSLADQVGSKETHADNLGYQCGGWTIEWQGLGGNTTVGTTILTAIKSAVGPSTEVVYEQNPDANYVKEKGFSYAVVVVGEPPYAETAGDNLNLTIPLDGGNTINNVCASLKCLVILISGRPLVIEPYLPVTDAFVAAWLPGTEGQGVTDAIFGDYGFHGKLSRTWFKSVDQLPMNVGDKHYDPLFPFGFGLNTTTVSENL
ncbi:hypothetical protein KI387_018402, partial [Taxus chinensis]